MSRSTLRARGRRAHTACRVEVALEALKVRAKVQRGLVAQLPVLFERLVDDPDQLDRDGRVEVARRHRRFAENRVLDVDGRRSDERAAAGQELVHDDSQREEVGARIQGFALHLLGRHVGDGSAGQAGWYHRCRLADRVRRDNDGQTKIQQLHTVGLRDKDIRRLQVAVHDSLGMRRS